MKVIALAIFLCAVCLSSSKAQTPTPVMFDGVSCDTVEEVQLAVQIMREYRESVRRELSNGDLNNAMIAANSSCRWGVGGVYFMGTIPGSAFTVGGELYVVTDLYALGRHFYSARRFSKTRRRTRDPKEISI